MMALRNAVWYRSKVRNERYEYTVLTLLLHDMKMLPAAVTWTEDHNSFEILYTS